MSTTALTPWNHSSGSSQSISPASRGEFGVDAVGRDDQIGFDRVEFVAGDADDLSVLLEQTVHPHVRQDAAAGLARLLVDALLEPGVHLATEHGIAPVGVVFVEIGQIVRLDRVSGHVVDVVVRDRPLGGFLAEAVEEVVERVGAESSA